jgi:NADPH-dependent ferric siderophore reductase
MAETPSAPPSRDGRSRAGGRRTTTLVVRGTERVTPHLIRVVAEPADPADLEPFTSTPHTDAYIKVVFPRPGVRYPEPFDMATARELPREQWPALRTYTVREVRDGALVIDFVYHGETGLAGPWAARVNAGDELHVLGPGGAYSPDPDADWHLMVGDESALPAISAALARVPAGAPVHAFVQVRDAAEELPPASAGELRLTWLHRGNGDDGLLDAVRGLDWPSGRVHAFVHGEAGEVKALRRHLVDERGLSTDQLSISGYWRRGFDDESYREAKAAERTASSSASAG